MHTPRIALIHATPLAIAPVEDAFRRLWPQARVTSLLDDSLPGDLKAAGALTDAITQRFIDLAAYVVRQGADGILFTCSAFGPALEAAAATVRVPTLKPNEAMFEQALAACGDDGTPGLVTTFAPSSVSMREEYEAMARDAGASTRLLDACADGAMALLQSGDQATHDRLVVDAARRLGDARLLMLGQFSMAHAAGLVAQATGKPVLTSPDSAVRKLQQRLA